MPFCDLATVEPLQYDDLPVSSSRTCFRRFAFRFSGQVFYHFRLLVLVFVWDLSTSSRMQVARPGGLRKASESAVPEGASGVLDNFIKSFPKSFANPAGLFGLFLSKKLF